MNKGVWIYDLECFSNFFSYYAINKDTNEEIFYYIHDNINQWKELLEHLHHVKLHIGYNNLSYDYPLLHNIIKEKRLLSTEEIYNISQEIINMDYSVISDKETLIKQLDLFKINHYDNKAKSTSLKWLEFTLRWNKLQDLPFHHSYQVQKKDIEDIKSYNRNDVLATKMFLEKHCITDIKFRYNMSAKLNHNVLNYNDVKIGEYLNRITYEKLSGRNYKEFKDQRTYHKLYKLSDIIENGIEFQTDYLKDFFNELKLKSFKTEDDPAIDTILKFANSSFKFAKGGLHSEDIPRIESKKDNEILVEKDVASFYPASIINSKLYPHHLGIEWYNGVKKNYDRRTFEIKPLMKSLDKSSKEYIELDAEQASIKLSLNGGKT